jgi:hypothetical protein
MAGFGSGKFGAGPFGQSDWSRQTLYYQLPEIYRSQDTDGLLKAWTETVRGPVDNARSRIRTFGDLRDSRFVRTAYDETTNLRLGPAIIEKGKAEQAGVSGVVTSLLEFVAPTGRFNELDRSKELEVFGSAFPDNNRTVTITNVINSRTVLTNPTLTPDTGLRWTLRQKATVRNDRTLVEVWDGDVQNVVPGWKLFDGDSEFEVVGRKMFNPSQDDNSVYLTHKEGSDGIIVRSDDLNETLFMSRQVKFTQDDIGRILSIPSLTPSQWKIDRWIGVEGSGAEVETSFPDYTAVVLVPVDQEAPVYRAGLYPTADTLFLYKMNEGDANDAAIDLTGNCTITDASGTRSVVAGKYDSARYFNGNGRLRGPTTAAIRTAVTNRNYTIDFWAYIPSVSVPIWGNWAGLISVENDTPSSVIAFSIAVTNTGATNPIQMLWGSSATSYNFISSGSGGEIIPTNQWAHFAITVTNAGGSASSARLWVNGVGYAAMGGFNGIPNGAGSPYVVLGSQQQFGGVWTTGPFTGGLDEVRLTNRILTPTEIAAVAAGNSKPRADYIGPPALSTPSYFAVLPRPCLELSGSTVPKGAVEQYGFDLQHVSGMTNPVVRMPSARLSESDELKNLVLHTRYETAEYEIADVAPNGDVTLTGPALVNANDLSLGIKWEIRSISDSPPLSILSKTTAHAPALIDLYARDFGIEVNRKESANRQRDWVGHVSDWINVKGSAEAYRIIGELSGYSVTAQPLYLLDPETAPGVLIDSADWIVAPSSEIGRFGSDGSLTLVSGRLRFSAPTAAFTGGDIGRRIQLDDCCTGANDKIYKITEFIDSTTVQFSVEDYDPGSMTVPDLNNPGLTWAVVRIYALNTPLLPRYDEINFDAMQEFAGTDHFAPDTFCTEDGFWPRLPAYITGTSSQGVNRFKVTVQDTLALRLQESGLPFSKDVHTLALWHMDEPSGTAVADAVGTYNLTAQNGASIVAGVYSNARSFDGSDDHLSVAADAAMKNLFRTGSWTVGAWVYPTSVSGYRCWFACTSPGAGGELMGIYFAPGSNNVYLEWQLSGGSIDHYIASTAAYIPLNTWSHVEVSWASAGATGVFTTKVNGVLRDTSPSQSTPRPDRHRSADLHRTRGERVLLLRWAYRRCLCLRPRAYCGRSHGHVPRHAFSTVGCR